MHVHMYIYSIESLSFKSNVNIKDLFTPRQPIFSTTVHDEKYDKKKKYQLKILNNTNSNL